MKRKAASNWSPGTGKRDLDGEQRKIFPNHDTRKEAGVPENPLTSQGGTSPSGNPVEHGEETAFSPLGRKRRRIGERRSGRREGNQTPVVHRKAVELQEGAR